MMTVLKMGSGELPDRRQITHFHGLWVPHRGMATNHE
jgi:hypothetical protein